MNQTKSMLSWNSKLYSPLTKHFGLGLFFSVLRYDFYSLGIVLKANNSKADLIRLSSLVDMEIELGILGEDNREYHQWFLQDVLLSATDEFQPQQIDPWYC